MKTVKITAYRRRKGHAKEVSAHLPDVESAVARMKAKGKANAEAYKAAFDGSLGDSWDCGRLAGPAR